MQLIILVILSLFAVCLGQLSKEEATQILCRLSNAEVEGGVIISNQLVLATLCGLGDGECKDKLPPTEFGVPIQCSQVVESQSCQQENILQGDYCALSCGRCAKCSSTLAGCQCQLPDWTFQISGEVYVGCANPDNDQNGPWCLVDERTCEGSPAGKGYDYCDPTCLEDSPPAQSQETGGQQPESAVQGSGQEELERVATVNSEDSPRDQEQTSPPPPSPQPPSPTSQPSPSPQDTPASSQSPAPSSSSSSGATLSGAQGTQPQDWIAAHNFYRRKHCADDLQWDESLAQTAKEAALACSVDEQSNVGNLYITYDNSVTAATVLGNWYGQGRDYDYSAENIDPTSPAMTMTQVLWQNSQRVGCGVGETCKDGTLLTYCVYGPSGNILGQFKQNVLPESCSGQSENGSGMHFESSSVPVTNSNNNADQSSPASPSAWTDAHNRYRSQHCVDDVSWNQEIADLASEFAGSCGVQDARGYGRNIFTYTGQPEEITAEKVIDFWYDQGSGYDFSNPVFDQNAGLMTQVIWKATTEIGCGIGESCSDGLVYAYCLYDPSGNRPNQMQENVQEKCSN
eukprot:TRINITY_DN8913_c0_g2_i4.p1 TRINITY_DN8913_c0_g2~~TRINITY_DN8913_c0_g2_i4.p1  ORF type:complete len:571 (-),score=72.72 TRINITY_DN8913_c0_g2_i4:3381-5093(-)